MVFFVARHVMEVRSLEEIFEELSTLTHSRGFLNALSKILYRDFFLSIDLETGTYGTSSGVEHLHSRSRLNSNELLLLLGLLVQADAADAFEKSDDVDDQVKRVDELLEEFHQLLEKPMREMIRAQSKDSKSSNFGEYAREFIYYGAESAYDFQFANFARDRYRNDTEWFLRTQGISIRPLIEIARFIMVQINMRATLSDDSTESLSASKITEALSIEKKVLKNKFGGKVENFYRLFALKKNGENKDFNHPFSFNMATARPLIDMGDSIYVASHYKLLESMYDSPFFWMMRDAEYADHASQSRGEFAEQTSYEQLVEVFGEKHVFKNVFIKRAKGEMAAEADVLVVYGEFALVVQAKSKRLTLQARAGDADKIRDDFQNAVQAAYDQAVTFADLLIAGAECIVKGKSRQFKFVSRVFPIVILSDHFPSLSILTQNLLKIQKNTSPIVIDIFFLEVMCKLLNEPTELIYYLQQRARFFPKLHTDSEYNILGFHIRHKLYISSEYDFVALNKDFATPVDEIALGLKTDGKSTKIMEKIDVPKMKELVSFLKEGPPELAGITIELLDFSSDSLANIVTQIDNVRAEVRAGKALKSFSIDTSFGGLSYVAVDKYDQEALRAASQIAEMHKYKMKKDRWYVLVDYVNSKKTIDAALPIWSKWEASNEMEKFYKELGAATKSTLISLKPDLAPDSK